MPAGDAQAPGQSHGAVRIGGSGGLVLGGRG
jgi:hypothetical protein